MKKHIIRDLIPLYSPEWYAYRKDYVNGSEVGAIMGLSEYGCAAKSFNEKIGRIEPWSGGNKNTYWGLQLEDLIAKTWMYYHPDDPESYIENQKEGKIIRKARNFNGYFRNPKYPWLSCSLDRVISIGSFNLVDKQPLDEEAPLEIKNMNAFALGKWETLPLDYLAQVHVQMIIMETRYGELAIKDSNNNFHVWPIPYDDNLGNLIIEQTEDFSKRVGKARTLIVQLQEETDEEKKKEMSLRIEELEPPPPTDGNMAYEEFIKEKYRSSYEPTTKDGTQQDFEDAVNYVQIGKEIKGMENKRQAFKNQLLHSLGPNEILSFGESGKVTYQENKKGSRVFNVKLT